MKIFVSYAFTGEDIEVLRKRLTGLRQLFDSLKIDYYINMFAPEWQDMMDSKATGGEFLDFALENMKSCDTVLVINASDRRSEGSLMEIGAAVAMDKKIVLVQHQSSVGSTYTPSVADDTFTWSSEEELLEKVKTYFSASNKS